MRTPFVGEERDRRSAPGSQTRRPGLAGRGGGRCRTCARRRPDQGDSGRPLSHLCAQTTRPGRLGAAVVALCGQTTPSRQPEPAVVALVRADDPIQATRAGRCHTCARKRPNQWWIKRRPRGQPCEGRLLVCAPASIAHARRLSRNGQRSRSTLVREPGQICDATRRADSGARVFLAAYGSSARAHRPL